MFSVHFTAPSCACAAIPVNWNLIYHALAAGAQWMLSAALSAPKADSQTGDLKNE